MLDILDSVRVKLLTRHQISEHEILEAFANREGKLYEAEGARTNPPTQCFVAETNRGRLLQITFALNGRRVIVKDARATTEDNLSEHLQPLNDNAEQLDNALNIKPLCVRLSHDNLSDFKSIAAMYGIGHQALLKQILNHFIDREQKMLANELIRETLKQRQKPQQIEEDTAHDAEKDFAELLGETPAA